jgi:hypothetical protein
MDALSNFAKGQTGTVLGFVGIAITYIITAIFDKPIKPSDIFARIGYFVIGIVFIILAALAYFVGTVKVVDPGIILAYLGIGAGLLCTAWSIRANNKAFWAITILGLAFEIVGLLLEINAGLV